MEKERNARWTRVGEWERRTLKSRVGVSISTASKQGRPNRVGFLLTTHRDRRSLCAFSRQLFGNTVYPTRSRSIRKSGVFGDNYPVRFELPHIIIKLLESRHTSSVPDSNPIVPHIFNFTLLKRLCQRLGNFTKISITI